MATPKKETRRLTSHISHDHGGMVNFDSPDINEGKGTDGLPLCNFPVDGESSNFLSSSSRIGARSSSAYTSKLEFSKLAKLDQPNYVEAVDVKSKRKMRKIRRAERERTNGSKWYHMPATELTQERKNDLEALRLRGALDTKRFYKRNNIVNQPKYFQVGKIIEAPADYYNSRVPKRQRKKTLAEEMVAEVSSLRR